VEATTTDLLAVTSVSFGVVFRVQSSD